MDGLYGVLMTDLYTHMTLVPGSDIPTPSVIIVSVFTTVALTINPAMNFKTLLGIH